MGPGGPFPLQLLDRAAEVAAIAAAIESACSGSGSALLVEGVAGIGKTRLLTHACEQAAQAGMTVLAARAAEFEDGYAWGVVRQLFEAEIRADGGQRLTDDAVALAALALTRDAQRGDEDSFAVLHGLYWLAADIAQQAPLLLAVDDLHWADQPSQRFVAHLAHRLEGLAVLLVLTVREPRSGTAQQKSLIAGLAGEASVIALRPAALGAAACAEQARALLAAGDLNGQLGPTWPYNVVRHARGCLLAAAGDHASAVRELLEAGELAELWGVRNPTLMPWRSDAALSLIVLGDGREASRLCAEEVELAERWSAPRGLGIALRAAGVAEGGSIELLTEAVSVLRRSPARLELARALIDLGAAQRRAGSRARARESLREGLDLAHALGGIVLADRARRELVIAGGRPRRDATRGRDALTPSELRVAQLAAGGQTNRQIAQALFVTQRTVENHLTSTYAKLGISSRPELPAALAGHRPATRV